MAAKRKWPELETLRESRRQQAAGLAKRQGSALGKQARERLKQLIRDKRSGEQEAISIPKLEVRFELADSERIRARMEQAILNSFTTPVIKPATWLPLANPFLTNRFLADSAPVAPTIGAEKLDSLKRAEAYKVMPQVPDMVEVITGWRGWSVSGMRLTALGQSHEWPCRAAMSAVCTKGQSHLSPDWNCTCGIWAFKDVDKAAAAIGGGYRTIRVIGSVSLWGKVIETENGYRAQYAYPSELWLLDDSLEELGLVYDVPVRRAAKV